MSNHVNRLVLARARGYSAPMQGLHCFVGAPRAPAGLEALGPFSLGGSGRLHSRAEAPGVVLHFEGALTAGRRDGASDAEVALDAFRARGIDGLRDLDGFYNVLAVTAAPARAVLVCDATATRTLYLYRGDGAAALAPEPHSFRAAGLPLSLDRLGLYHLFRLQHPVGPRTLMAEVARNRPFTWYEIDAEARVTAHTRWPLRKEPDDSLDVDTAARRMRDIHAEVTEGILSHPLLAGLPIHLPLTAGMDSRHILAELDAQGRPPARIKHVRLWEQEVRPVRQMASALGIPLDEVDLADLDLREVTARWARRTGGLVSFHQAYLFGVEPGAGGPDVVGFDGYLADYFFGFCPMAQTPSQRHYTRQPVLARLFEDHEALGQAHEAALAEQLDHFEGSDFYRQTCTDALNRGPGYTGAVFPVLSDSASYFGPGAHARAFEFFRTAPESVAGVKRARLRLFRNHFPKLGAFPDEYGANYNDLDTLPLKPKKKARDALRVVRAAVTGLRYDPAPESEHAWLRQIPFMARLHQRVVEDSRLARDGHVPAAVGRDLWRRHRRGGYHAWPLLSLATAEIAYRLLVCGEAVDDVIAWLAD